MAISLARITSPYRLTCSTVSCGKFPQGPRIWLIRNVRPYSVTMLASLAKTTDPFRIGQRLRGHSGTLYKIEEVLSERQSPQLRVYRARSVTLGEGFCYCATDKFFSASRKPFIVKDLVPGEFEYQKELQSSLSACQNLRCMVDTVNASEILVYRYFTSDLLQTSQKPLPIENRKSILRHALTELVELHEKNVLHNDIKPDNILIDYHELDDGQIIIKTVQIGDLEDSAQLQPGKAIAGRRPGNQLWRSPESWARARQHLSSDIFSFGILIIYVMLNRMVFLVPEVANKAEEAWQRILWRHISFFGDRDGFNGLLRILGEKNPFHDRLIAILNDPENGLRKPFSMWPDVNLELRDLVVKMTNLDPDQRITAREALEQPWFHSDAGAWEQVELVIPYWP